MSFSWNDYLVCAKSLTVVSGTDADFRTAISRAYYVAYHHTRIALGQYLTLSPREPAHVALWQGVNALRKGPSAKLSFAGANLKSTRQKADYELRSTPYTVRDAESAIKSAENLLTLLSQVVDCLS